MLLGIIVGSLLGAFIGGLAGYLGSSYRFYVDNKRLIGDVKQANFFADEATSHKKAALAFTDEYEKRTLSAEKAAQEAAHTIKKTY